ncbi:hypothetical protein [Vallitalea okinawensis]|uniref:hypothetical protein n=1 Tax=Vallitalea okinawensis TaxID=2078660 RepID=UPI001300A1A6|nr:hypothetical protein [Vallitalea okinawensis]
MSYMKPRNADDIVLRRQIEGLEYAIQQDKKNNDKESLKYHQIALSELKRAIEK